MPFKARKAHLKKPSSQQSSRTAEAAAPQTQRAPVIQRARRDSHGLTRHEVMHLQQKMGNRAVGRLLSPSSRSTDAGRSRPVAQRKQAPCKDCPPVQRMDKEEEPPMQRMEKEEDEPPMQRMEKEEDEPLMQRMEKEEDEPPMQRMEKEEDEPLMQRMEKEEDEPPMQRMEKEEEEPPMQRMEEREEEPMQGKFATGSTSARGGGVANATGMPGPLKAGLEGLSGKDLSDVRVHRNSSKPAQVNALAYTQGKDIHVAPGQERHLPHEGWHAVQQMQGRVKPTIQAKGVSINNDASLEREADVMGRKALRMEQPVRPGAVSKTDAIHHKGGTHINSNTMQRFVKYTQSDQSAGSSLGWKHPDSNYLKVAEDGEVAMGGYRQAWATDKRRDEGEKALKANYSQVKLEKGTKTIKGKQPRTGTGNDITLTEVKAMNRDGSGRADLTADCGTAARETLGVNRKSDKFCARYEGGGGPKLTTPRTYHGGTTTTPDYFADEIFKQHFGTHLSSSAARARYQALPDNHPTDFDKDDFDKKYKINKYAVPNLGQAITANEPSGWNFHFAGVLLKSSEDYITGENYPGSGRGEQSWYFGIYGPASKSQTFHDKWAAAGGGTTTMVIDVKETDRPLFMLKKAIKNENGEFIIQALKKAKALSIPLKTIIDHADTGLMEMLYATDDKHINDVLKILKADYLPTLTAAERTALVLKGAKGYTFEREVNLIKSIMEISTTKEYVETVSAVEKEVSSESDDIIVESLIDSSGKLALSRVPKNLTAKQAIILVKSLISGACIGDDERAVYLIMKSLTSKVFQAVLNTLSLDYFDSGLDGAQWDEFLVLVATRYTAGKNVGALRIASEKNDDAARLLVNTAGIKGKLSYTEWIGIIKAMLAGNCGQEDELAIIKIVKWFQKDGQLGLINSSIGESAMDSGVDGKEWGIVAGIMKGAGYNWSTWYW